MSHPSFLLLVLNSMFISRIVHTFNIINTCFLWNVYVSHRYPCFSLHTLYWLNVRPSGSNDIFSFCFFHPSMWSLVLPCIQRDPRNGCDLWTGKTRRWRLEGLSCHPSGAAFVWHQALDQWWHAEQRIQWWLRLKLAAVLGTIQIRPDHTTMVNTCWKPVGRGYQYAVWNK